MLTPEQLRKLESIKNRHTKYEVVVSRGAQRLRLGYSARKGKTALFDMARMHAATVVKLTGCDQMTFAKQGACIGDWLISFSGRTQRECILTGELRHITEVAQ